MNLLVPAEHIAQVRGILESKTMLISLVVIHLLRSLDFTTVHEDFIQFLGMLMPIYIEFIFKVQLALVAEQAASPFDC